MLAESLQQGIFQVLQTLLGNVLELQRHDDLVYILFDLFAEFVDVFYYSGHFLIFVQHACGKFGDVVFGVACDFF